MMLRRISAPTAAARSGRPAVWDSEEDEVMLLLLMVADVDDDDDC